MKIYWHGKTCFEIIINEKTQEPVSVIIDPIDKTYPKKDTDILVLTHAVEYNKKEKVFTISAAGEYEIKDVYVQGIPLKEGGLIFIIKSEGIKICHLGKTDIKELSDDELGKLGLIDILLINAGEEDDKTRIIKQLEPATIIPMDYDNVEGFLKKLGESNKESTDYYKVQKKDFDNLEEAEIIVLNKK
ncbi:MAG TPA: MBL fold metallo-hydrolase [Candidatus Pacearchaeota archaeon]|nr:MBL fold metallo-hydrolase [Candidatus Pacearchaeota archaeon]